MDRVKTRTPEAHPAGGPEEMRDLAHGVLRAATESSHLSTMLRHGGISHYADCARANPDWEPFLRREIRMDY